MKLRYLLLIAIALIIPAQFASANPVDPTVIINKTDPPTVTMFSMNSASDPLVIQLTNGLAPEVAFEYTGTTPLTQLFVQLDGATLHEQFFCGGTLFTGMCGNFSTGVGNDEGIIFNAAVGSGEMLENGDEITVAVVATPELGTIVLLLTGGVLLIGFGRRW